MAENWTQLAADLRAEEQQNGTGRSYTSRPAAPQQSGGLADWISDRWTDDFSSIPVLGPIASGTAAGYTNVMERISLGANRVMAPFNQNIQRNLGSRNIDDVLHEISPGQNLLSMGATDYDVTNAVDRQRVFGQGGAQWGSGLVDAAATWFLDPGVVLGKVAKVARFGMEYGPLANAGMKLSVKNAQSVRMIETAADDALSGTENAMRVEARRWVAADFTAAKNLDTAQGANRDLVAGIAAGITNEDDAIIFIAAASGSEKYMNMLGQRYANARAAFGRAVHNEYEARILNAPLGSTPRDLLDDLLAADGVNAKQIMADMRLRNPEYAALDRAAGALTDAEDGQRMLIQNFGYRSARQKEMSYAWREGKAYRRSWTNGKIRDTSIAPKASWGTGPALQETVFQLSSFMPRVRVWEWATGQHGNGYVDIAGFNDGKASDGLIAALSDSKTLRKDQAWIREQVNKFGMATSQQGRFEAVNGIEKAAMVKLLTVKLEAQGRTFTKAHMKQIEDLYGELDERRFEYIQKFRAKGAYAVDEGGDVIEAGPVLSSQLEYQVPILDMRTMEKAASILAKPRYSSVTAKSLKSNVGDAFYASKAMRDEFLSFWKASVLLRLGYTVRNTGEGWLRTLAYTGGLPQIRAALPGVAHAGYNWSRGIRKGTVRGKERAINDAITDIIDSEARLAAVKAERRKALKDDPSASTVDFDRAIADHEANIDALKSSVENLKAKLANLKSRKRLGDNGAFGRATFKGAKGEYVVDNTAMADLLRRTAGADRTREIFLQESLRQGKKQTLAENSWVKVTPDKDQYWQELSSAGRQLRNDKVVEMLLSGEKRGKVVAWLESADGRGYRNNMRLTKNAAADRVVFLEDMLKRYFPTKESRTLLAERVPTDLELRELLGGLKNLSPIHGREVQQYLSGRMSFLDMARAGRDKAFIVLGSHPESALVRHPFYAEMWDKRMRMMIKSAEEQGVNITDDVLEKMNRSAHRFATRETNEVLFTIERYSNAAYATRWVMPFYAAWENSAKVWAKMVWKDPSILARANILWNMPAQLGMVVDKDGNPVKGEAFDFIGDRDKFIKLPSFMASWVQDRMGGAEIKIPLASLNVVTPGETPYLPGLGPIATIPVGLWLQNKPDVAKDLEGWMTSPIFRQFVPNGQPQDAGSIAPPWMRKLLTMWRGEGDAAYLATSAALMQSAVTDHYKYGTPIPSAEEILARTNSFYKWSAIFSVTLPFSTTRSSKYQVEVDYWHRLLQDDSMEYDKKITTFLEKFPYGSALTVSSAKNSTRLSPDQATYSTLQDNDTLARALHDIDPNLVGMLSSSLPVGEFDYGVYNWMQENGAPGSDQPYRDRMGPSEMYNSIVLSDAWRDYRKVKTYLDDLLAQRKAAGGSDSLRAAENQDLKEKWEQYTDVTMVEQYGAPWVAAFNSFKQTTAANLTGIQMILSDKNFTRAGDPMWDQVAEYMKIRQAGIDLIAQGADPTEIKDKFAAWVSDFKDSSLQFSDFYDKYLDQDDLTEIGLENL